MNIEKKIHSYLWPEQNPGLQYFREGLHLPGEVVVAPVGAAVAAGDVGLVRGACMRANGAC